MQSKQLQAHPHPGFHSMRAASYLHPFTPNLTVITGQFHSCVKPPVKAAGLRSEDKPL